MFVEKELITAPLNGLVLPGITRKSLLDLGRKWVCMDLEVVGKLFCGISNYSISFMTLE